MPLLGLLNDIFFKLEGENGVMVVLFLYCYCFVLHHWCLVLTSPQLQLFGLMIEL